MTDLPTFAHVAILPWVRKLLTRYQAADLAGFADFAEVSRGWLVPQRRPVSIT